MEGPGRPEVRRPSLRLQEQPVAQRIVRKLGGVIKRRAIARRGEDVSQPGPQNGNGNGAHPSNGVPPSKVETTQTPPTKLELMVASRLVKILEKDIEEEDQRAAENEGYAPPLELGPQRYTDPAMWGPDYKKLPKESPERQAWEAGSPIPLTEDKRWQIAGELVDKLDAAVGPWPGSK
jgi:hypothetical protein